MLGLVPTLLRFLNELSLLIEPIFIDGWRFFACNFSIHFVAMLDLLMTFLPRKLSVLAMGIMLTELFGCKCGCWHAMMEIER